MFVTNGLWRIGLKYVIHCISLLPRKQIYALEHMYMYAYDRRNLNAPLRCSFINVNGPTTCQNSQESSICNVGNLYTVFSVDTRCQKDPHLMKLIKEKGISKSAKEHAISFKPLQLAGNVASTFLGGGQSRTDHAELLKRYQETLKSSPSLPPELHHWNQEPMTFSEAASTWISRNDAEQIKKKSSSEKAMRTFSIFFESPSETLSGIPCGKQTLSPY